ncbi:hypothetical protein EDB84DRAFT_315001 [Lactarius hengduanensis]|nr:hypothetical protein EDB84DRAFT_315001 [Lactarius hengduanensis]
MTTLLSWQLVRIRVVACRDHGSISRPAGYRATTTFLLDRLSSVISCTWTRVAPVFCKDLCLTNRLCTVWKSVTDSIPCLKPPTFRISIYSLFRLFTQHIQLMFRRLSLYVYLNHDLSPVPMPWVASGSYHMASSVTCIHTLRLFPDSGLLCRFYYEQIPEVNKQSSCPGSSASGDHMDYSNMQFSQLTILPRVLLLGGSTCNALTDIQLYCRQARVFLEY